MMTTSPRSQIISISDLEWREYQPGIRFKILWEDPPTKRRAQLTRFEPGAQLPLHRHVGDELIFVIEGAVSDGTAVMPPSCARRTGMGGHGGARGVSPAIRRKD